MGDSVGFALNGVLMPSISSVVSVPLKNRLNQELSERTSQPLEKIQEDTDRDFFMSPNEAVDYGLIDSVIDKRPVHSV